MPLTPATDPFLKRATVKTVLGGLGLRRMQYVYPGFAALGSIYSGRETCVVSWHWVLLGSVANVMAFEEQLWAYTGAGRFRLTTAFGNYWDYVEFEDYQAEQFVLVMGSGAPEGYAPQPLYRRRGVARFKVMQP